MPPLQILFFRVSLQIIVLLVICCCVDFAFASLWCCTIVVLHHVVHCCPGELSMCVLCAVRVCVFRIRSHFKVEINASCMYCVKYHGFAQCHPGSLDSGFSRILEPAERKFGPVTVCSVEGIVFFVCMSPGSKCDSRFVNQWVTHAQ